VDRETVGTLDISAHDDIPQCLESGDSGFPAADV